MTEADIVTRYKASRRFVVHFSGGKDSTATWLHLSRDLGLNTLCLFCDTGHEAQDTYDYVSFLRDEHGMQVEFITPLMRDLWKNVPAHIDPNETLNMEKLCAIKKTFPSPTRRFCSQFLKVVPLARWHREHGIESDIIAVGIRSDESLKRAKMQEFVFDDLMQRNRWLPIFNWQLPSIWEIHEKHGVPRNPLYDMGVGRVGCYPCIMSRKDELKTYATKRPDMFNALHQMEKRVAAAAGKPFMSFFAGTAVAQKYRSHTCQNSGKMFGDALDVWRWATEVEPKFADNELFYNEEDDPDVFALCDIYGVCE